MQDLPPCEAFKKLAIKKTTILEAGFLSIRIIRCLAG